MQLTSRSARALIASVAVLLATAALAACGSDDDESEGAAGGGSTAAEGSGEPIKVGNISAVTGPIPLADASEGTRAYFEALNAEGGINGQPVEFIVRDDKTDPALSARAARDLIQQEEVVALVGDLTLVGCGVNRQVLEQNDVRSIMGGGADPACFVQPNVSPVNTGHINDWRLTLLYAANELGAENMCALFTNTPTLMDSNQESIAYFEEQTGQELTYVDRTLSQNSNLPAIFATAKRRNCDAVLTDGTPDQTVPMVNARDQQQLDAPLIFMGAQYNSELGGVLGDAEDVYSIAELEPFTGDHPLVVEMEEDFDAAGIEVNSLAQFGWFAGWVFHRVAEGIDGPVTREAMNEALLALDSLDTEGMTATPYAFGEGETHNPNRGGKIVKIENGEWMVETEDWQILPEGD